MTDTSHGHATEKEARDVAEAARETEWQYPSFVRELFLGRFRLDLIHPHPEHQDPDEAIRADEFLSRLAAFLERIDSDEIDRTGEIPEPLVQELREMGAFGIKIPREYGGLGLSQMTYIRAIEMVTSKDGSFTALLSAAQSIGVPQPLKLFGTPEQKKKYLPRCAAGAISAFALTEPHVGSDPASLSTTARRDGDDFVLNGEKLWCTDGTLAELLVLPLTPEDEAPDAPAQLLDYLPTTAPVVVDLPKLLDEPTDETVAEPSLRERLAAIRAKLPLDVEALARGEHMSAGHLSRQFRLAYGESPYSYLMTRRIERAMSLLRRGDLSVTEVCFEVGCSSLGTFSTRFTELVGVPPSVYQREAAGATKGMPACVAKKVTRPIRNREARGSPPHLA